MVVHDPEVCRCYQCSLIIWDRSQAELEDYTVRTAIPTIEIEKVKGNGEDPPFLGILHRHFEKAVPISSIPVTKKVTLVADLGMLEFILPHVVLQDVESLEINYEKRA